MARKDWGAWRTKLINVPGYIEGGHAIKFKDLMKGTLTYVDHFFLLRMRWSLDITHDFVPSSNL